MSARVNQGGGRGLWSVAFHPNYPATPYVFAHYVEIGTEDSIIARYELSPDDPNRALAGSEVILLRMPKPIRLHYGGQLAFGPDGYLYISTGDGTDGTVGPDPLCLSQKLDSLEGKLLRIDVDADGALFGIPSDNPFAGSAEPSIWAYGLRNPWRFSFDRENGELWISDVGENRREEINRQPASSSGGENYGWKIMEGTDCFSNLNGCGLAPACNDPSLTLPAIDYGHAQGRCSVIGGYVYRGSLVPELYGRYVYGDFCSGEVWYTDAVVPSFAGSVELAQTVPLLGSFGEGADGELYALGTGTLFRVVDPAVTGAGVVEFDRTRIEVDESAGTFTVPVRRVGDGDGAVSVEYRTADGSASGGSDFVPASGILSWPDGDLDPRSVTVQIVGDADFEATETFQVLLENPAGGARLGPRSGLTGVIQDDDTSCVPSATLLCLNDGRFRVTIDWRTAVIVGCFLGRSMRGACELYPIDKRRGEIAVSVERRFQRRGIGREMLSRTLLLARNRGMVELEFRCFTHNGKMRGLVR
ncbi:MAG: GNAT family N-acetyltransferase, partial [Acidobacteriota bacterium]